MSKRKGIFKVPIKDKFIVTSKCQYGCGSFIVPYDVPHYPLCPYCKKIAWSDKGIDLSKLLNRGLNE